MADSLAIITKARRALAEAKTLDDVLAVRDQAEAARQLLKVRGESVAAQNEAGEVKLRAERLLGDSLSAVAKPGRKRLHDATISLADMGIEKTQSHRWQAIADIPEDEFETFIANALSGEEKLTSAAALRLARELARPIPVPVVHTAPVAGIISDLDDVAGQRFGTIYADPPWRYANLGTRANVDRHYAGTMSAPEICNMPVESLAADDAHLHLWTTNSFIREAFDVMDAWGFEYRSMFVWVKPQMGIGNYWRVSHELLLLGVRGDAKRFSQHKHKSWGEYPRTEHSAKPEEIRYIIEAVSPGPRLELFGRKSVEGWTVFGNQVERRLIPA